MHYFYYQTPPTSISAPNFFGTETFWVAVGSLVTAATLIYFISKDWREQKRSVENIKRALYFEMLANIEGLFTGEVERKPIFEAMNTVRRDFAKVINDPEMFSKFQALYSELDYYQTFVEKVYLKDERWEQRGHFVTEKQLSTQNKFLEFFGEPTIPLTWGARGEMPPAQYADSLRDAAIAIKRQKIASWKTELEQRINQIFD